MNFPNVENNFDKKINFFVRTYINFLSIQFKLQSEILLNVMQLIPTANKRTL